MKKLIAILCTITCLFGLTACGSGEALSEYGQHNADNAQQLADEMVLYLFAQYAADEAAAESFSEYTAEEIEYMLNTQYNIQVDGNAFLKGISSFRSAGESMGAITGTNGSEVRVDDSEIIVEVEVTGEKKNAKAEMIFSNDMFLTLKSAALNPSSTIGELMANAGLNTLIGMGTVFAVLILISLIISCFKVIPKIQNSMAKKKAPAAEAMGVDNAVMQIVEQETIVEEDDCELVAVIAAAIAAGEGAVTTDGFVVRSIRRR